MPATSSAIVTRSGDFRDPLIVFLAHYAQDPNLGVSSDVTQVGGVTFVNGADGRRIETTAYDLRVTGGRPGDVVFVFSLSPSSSCWTTCSSSLSLPEASLSSSAAGPPSQLSHTTCSTTRELRASCRPRPR